MCEGQCCEYYVIPKPGVRITKNLRNCLKTRNRVDIENRKLKAQNEENIKLTYAQGVNACKIYKGANHNRMAKPAAPSTKNRTSPLKATHIRKYVMWCPTSLTVHVQNNIQHDVVHLILFT